jgi:hypothetical protein
MQTPQVEIIRRRSSSLAMEITQLVNVPVSVAADCVKSKDFSIYSIWVGTPGLGAIWN